MAKGKLAPAQTDPVIVILAFILGGLVLWKHRGNIARLIHGNENKFSIHRKKDKS